MTVKLLDLSLLLKMKFLFGELDYQCQHSKTRSCSYDPYAYPYNSTSPLVVDKDRVGMGRHDQSEGGGDVDSRHFGIFIELSAVGNVRHSTHLVDFVNSKINEKMKQTITSFLHKVEEFVQECLASGVIVEFVQLQRHEKIHQTINEMSH